MKFLIQIILFSFLLSYQIYANDVDSSYIDIIGEELIQKNSVTEDFGIIGHDENGYYVLKKDYQYYIEFFNRDLLFERMGRLKLSKGLRSRFFEGAALFYDSLYIFYSQQKFSSTVYYVETVDKTTLEMNNNPRIVLTLPHQHGCIPKLKTVFSRLRTKLILCFETKDLIKKNIHLDLIVYEKGLKQTWKNSEVISYNRRVPWNEDYILSEDGDFYYIAQIYESHPIFDMFSTLKNQFIIVSFNDAGQTINDYTFDIYDMFIRDIKIVQGDGGNFICTGLYSNSRKFSSCGVFYLTNNLQTGELNPVLVSEFSHELTSRLEPFEVRGENEIFTYHLKEAVLRADGSVVLAIQQEFEQHYNNINDIILVGFNAFGDVAWTNVIQKQQSGNEYTSFVMVAPADEIAVKILYNEHYKNKLNKDYTKRKSFAFPRPSYLVLAEVNDVGNITQSIISKRHRKELVPKPLATYDLRNGEIVMLSQKYRRYRFIKFNLF